MEEKDAGGRTSWRLRDNGVVKNDYICGKRKREYEQY